MINWGLLLDMMGCIMKTKGYFDGDLGIGGTWLVYNWAFLPFHLFLLRVVLEGPQLNWFGAVSPWNGVLLYSFNDTLFLILLDATYNLVCAFPKARFFIYL